VPEDLAPPHIEPIIVPYDFDARNGDTISLRARVHDAKIPARWHDFRGDPERGDPVHHRRLPYLEFAMVGSPDEFLALVDDDPQKNVATTGGAESEDGCGCRGDPTGSAPGLALLLLLGRRRSQRVL
jgi:MYXO-CTERM domain-containing protein